MKESSKVMVNLRSRKEYRGGKWQEGGIAGIKVSIQRPETTTG